MRKQLPAWLHSRPRCVGHAIYDEPQQVRLRIGVGTRGTLGDPDPLNTIPVKKTISRVKKGPF